MTTKEESDDIEVEKALEGMFDKNTEVVLFEVEKDICNLESKGERVSEISKVWEKQMETVQVTEKSTTLNKTSFTSTSIRLFYVCKVLEWH